jgi:hypothetical protein
MPRPLIPLALPPTSPASCPDHHPTTCCLRCPQSNLLKLEAQKAAGDKASAKAAREAEAQLKALQLEWTREKARLQDSVERLTGEVAQLRESNRNLGGQVRERDRSMAELRNKVRGGGQWWPGGGTGGGGGGACRLGMVLGLQLQLGPVGMLTYMSSLQCGPCKVQVC